MLIDVDWLTKGKENANMKILSRKCKMEHLKVKIYEKNKNNERKK